VPSFRRSYPQQPGARRRSPLRLLLVFLTLTALFLGIVLGVLVLSPDLTTLFPGPGGERLHALVTAARNKLEFVLSDQGPLGGLRRFVEPYLSRVNLSLATVLLGFGLLLLAIVCVRILVVTSKPLRAEPDETLGPEQPRPSGQPGGSGASPYWPYERRPGPGSATGASPGPSLHQEMAAQSGGVLRDESVSAGMPSASMATTGDAWPMIRPTGSDPAHVIRGSSEIPREAGSGEAFSTGGDDEEEFPASSPFMVSGASEAAAAVEPLPMAPSPPSPRLEEYLADMPATGYAMRTPLRSEEPPLPITGPRAEAVPGSEVWIESRPRLAAGVKRFALPGLLLFILGAGGAYSLQTPAASFITGGPYGIYLLASSGAVVSMVASMWFMNGPMRASVRKTTDAAAAPSLRALGGPGADFRTVAPAPIPARAALKGGLEAPDAAEWSKFPKPSIFFPGTQSATSVGVDIGTAWTKVVQIGVSRHGPEILNLGLMPTPAGALGEGDIADPELLGESIKELMSSRNIIQRQVTTALGGQGVIIRHVQFPIMSPDELREVLRWEAEHHIPIPPAEAVVDFTVMPGQVDADERGNRQMRVMLVGAQKRVVEAQVQALRRAKLVPKAVDAEALASYRVVRYAGHFEEDPLRYAQAVIDLGHSSTKLGIYLRGALEMSRTLASGGQAFTAALGERLRVPDMEAETLKRQYGVHPDGGRVLQALVPTLQDLMFEIRRSFEFFASRHFGQTVRYVYLVGGGARMPGIGGALARYLNPSLGERVPEGAETRVEVIDPLSAMPLTPRLGAQANLVGPEFVTALGLALTEEATADEG
jgi:type IV pilus assembly protein PilM